MTTNTLLTFTNVTKTYGQKPPVTVLDRINFSLSPGETVAVMGASGSGKTTMLSLAGGLDHTFEGTITLQGEDLGRMTIKKRDFLRQTHIGFLLQKPFLIQELSALENVMLPGLTQGLSTSKARQRATMLLTSVCLEKHIMNSKPSVLSPGQAQRVCLARTLMHTPALLICDEPTASLDASTASHVMDVLCKEVKERNTSLLLATHDHNVAQRCQRIVTITHGRIEQID